MRWEDERYVRVYTRDTGDWLELSFEAQALFLMLLRKVDRIGELRLGKRGRAAVPALVGHPERAADLNTALSLLLADGCVGLRDDGQVLVVPNFLKAQETPKSSLERKREQRARDAESAAEQSRMSRDDVTKRDTRDSGVTRHEMSLHAVLNQPCRAVPGGAAAPPPPAVNAISAAGALVVPAVLAGALPDRREEPRDGPTTLRDRLEVAWLAKKGRPYRWRTADDNAVRELLAAAGDSWPEIERRWGLALARTRFPTCSSIPELAKHWNAYATDEPKPEGRGRAPESAKYREGVPVEEAPF